MPLNALGNYVRQRRQDLNLSQEQLAERISVNCCQSDISRIERGHVRLPRLSTMASLAAALEISVGNLLIVTGWFDHEHLAAAPAPGVSADEEAVQEVLSGIDTELDAIGALQRQAASRSEDLRRMVRELKATTDGAATLIAAD